MLGPWLAAGPDDLSDDPLTETRLLEALINYKYLIRLARKSKSSLIVII